MSAQYFFMSAPSTVIRNDLKTSSFWSISLKMSIRDICPSLFALMKSETSLRKSALFFRDNAALIDQFRSSSAFNPASDSLAHSIAELYETPTERSDMISRIFRGRAQKRKALLITSGERPTFLAKEATERP